MAGRWVVMFATVGGLLLSGCGWQHTDPEPATSGERSVTLLEDAFTPVSLPPEPDRESVSRTQAPSAIVDLTVEPIEPEPEPEPEPEEPTEQPDEPVVEQAGPSVMITFDDGPTRWTPDLLAALEETGLIATFFVVGDMVRTWPDEWAMIQDSPHGIGWHSMAHRDMRAMSQAELDADLAAGLDLIGDASCFRPPYGLIDTSVGLAVERAGMDVELWTVDPRDWDSDDPAAVVDHIGERVSDGDVILLHDRPGADDVVRGLAKVLNDRGLDSAVRC